MINRKILMSGFSVVSALALMGGSAFALFTANATSTNNVFASGNAALQLSLNNADFDNTIPGPTFNGMFPGDSKSYEFYIKNNSSSAINLGLTADISAIGPADDGAQTIDNTLLVSWVCDPENDGYGDNTPTSSFSPRAWLDGGNAGLGSLAQGQVLKCQLTGTLPESADNTVAGQTVAFDALYNGTQQ